MEFKFRMNLQLFAETGEAASPPARDNVPPQDGDQQPARTFTQEDVDRIVNQRLARQQREADARVARARDEARTEAERLAAMTQEQRFQHEREQTESAMRERESSIAAREADLARRELRAEAIETLASRGLPRNLEQILNYSSAEACSQSIDAVEKVFRDAVKAEVTKQLAGSAVELRRGSQAAAINPGVQLAQNQGKAEAEAAKTANDIISRYM